MSAELIYCKKCRTEKELRYIGDEVVSETGCKCYAMPKFDNDYMVKVVKEIAEELTRKALCRKSQNGSTF